MDPKRFLVDTNCLVAILQSWHRHHERVTREIERRLDRGARLTVSAHSLAETYSVLTRMPIPHRMSPALARTVIATSIIENADVTALSSEAYIRLLQGAPERAITGGRIYDAIIVECAIRARVETIVTFNERHFMSLAPPSIQIVVPQ